MSTGSIAEDQVRQAQDKKVLFVGDIDRNAGESQFEEELKKAVTSVHKSVSTCFVCHYTLADLRLSPGSNLKLQGTNTVWDLHSCISSRPMRVSNRLYMHAV